MSSFAGKRILFIGDSITDCGRSRPSTGSNWESLGTGYVSHIDLILGAMNPSRDHRISNQGISGNTIRDVSERWQEDVIDWNPDLVSLLIGVNDVWRGFDCKNNPDAAVPIEEYEEKLSRVVSSTVSKVEKFIVLSPFFFESNLEDAFRKQVEAYSAVAKEIAQANGCLYVDLQAEFDSMAEHVYLPSFGWDRVHPNSYAGMIMARKWVSTVI